MTEYSWLSQYKRTWEEAKINDSAAEAESDQILHLRPLLRKLILVLDYSKSATKKDIKPSRYKVISQIAENFEDFFQSYNPLSKLQIIVAKNGRAVCETAKTQSTQAPEGEFSVQNSLELSLKMLEDTGPHWSNEVLIILNSLSTCDPGNVWDLLKKIQENYVRISVISTCSEFFELKEITQLTNGKWIIAKNEQHLKESWDLFAKVGHPANSAALIPMAFSWACSNKSPCACHLEMHNGFICPVCGCKVCKLPSNCPVCGYILISAPHLTKASLSMSPLQPFVQGSGVCIGCDGNGEWKCSNCSTVYCSVCQDFLRASMGKCLGCSFN